jgi:diguanylate cyclase (GGDEF)-like protein
LQKHCPAKRSGRRLNTEYDREVAPWRPDKFQYLKKGIIVFFHASNFMNDPLTGLPDRTDFLPALTDKTDAAAHQQFKFALLVVEINNFQHINLLHRYQTGDEILRQFAKILRKTARQADYLARIGDSKFALIMDKVGSEQHSKMAAYKIQRLLDEAIHIKHLEIHCTATIGIALFPANASEPMELLREAEIALGRAMKTHQHLGIANKDNPTESLKLKDRVADLFHSIENSELVLFFQPKIDAISGHPTGAEALIRWQHPELGLLAPFHFITLAETTGFISPMTDWVLSTALRLSARWTQKWGPLSVSVNVPPPVIEQSNFVAKLENFLGLWEREGRDLCIEVLEGSLISSRSSTHRTLKEVQALGVHVAIDDFGTGYSCMTYFRDVPANELKIDKSFIMELMGDEANQKIVNSIIEIAHRFDLSVIAEGVEDAESASMLQNLSCDQFQGFYYSRPMPADEFERWLEEYSPR